MGQRTTRVYRNLFVLNTRFTFAKKVFFGSIFYKRLEIISALPTDVTTSQLNSSTVYEMIEIFQKYELKSAIFFSNGFSKLNVHGSICESGIYELHTKTISRISRRKKVLELLNLLFHIKIVSFQFLHVSQTAAFHVTKKNFVFFCAC
jgi:hypothetical protein